MGRIPNSDRGRDADFHQVVDAFLAEPGLPFSHILSAERVGRIFAKHGNLFGMQGIYSTVIMVWSFLGQVLREGKEASCQAAVARIVTHQELAGLPVPTEDTGDYCRARAKLSVDALRELAREIGGELEASADPTWLWKDLHVKLVDGFTFTMPDTPANQAKYPQPSSQKKGVGLPIARACVLLSVATACALELAVGPYSGKQTGETALLRSLLDSFQKGDLLVADRFFCSFLLLALLRQRDVDSCTRMHQSRRVDFRRGRRLGRYDHLVVWTKPRRPDWMDQDSYDAIPDEMVMREIRFTVVEKGCRTKTLTLVTTLIDAERYSKEEIARLYGIRWNAELDIRSIKQTLGLNHVRCKSPEMVSRELWTTILGYNLIRTTGAAAALLHHKQPRQISFTSTCQYVLSSWVLFSSQLIAPEKVLKHCRVLLRQIAQCEVANRPGRLEPRVIKRRRHRYKLMNQSRAELKAQLERN